MMPRRLLLPILLATRTDRAVVGAVVRLTTGGRTRARQVETVAGPRIDALTVIAEPK